MSSFLIRDGPGDAWWLSDSIWTVRGAPDGPQGAPIVGKANYVWARVENLTENTISSGVVAFWWASPVGVISPKTATLIGRSHVSLGPREEKEVLCVSPWIPKLLNNVHKCRQVAAAYRTEAEFLAAAEQFTPFDPPNEPHVAQRNLTVVVQGIGMSALHAVISTLGLPSEKFQKLEAACLTGEQRRPISNKTLKYFDFTGEERRSVLLAVLKKEQEMQREAKKAATSELGGWSWPIFALYGRNTMENYETYYGERSEASCDELHKGWSAQWQVFLVVNTFLAGSSIAALGLDRPLEEGTSPALRRAYGATWGLAACVNLMAAMWCTTLLWFISNTPPIALKVLVNCSVGTCLYLPVVFTYLGILLTTAATTILAFIWWGRVVGGIVAGGLGLSVSLCLILCFSSYYYWQVLGYGDISEGFCRASVSTVTRRACEKLPCCKSKDTCLNHNHTSDFDDTSTETTEIFV